jgi:hypothetical protein
MIRHIPEVFVTCEECCGEGAFEQWEDGAEGALVITCQECAGIGGFICEAA